MIRVSADMAWIDGALRPGWVGHFDGGHLVELRRGGAADRHVRLLAPALADLQVNGSGGRMFNADPTPGTIAHIVATQRARGTGWVMPTLITCEAERMVRATEAALASIGLPGFLGLHLEGPHIAPERRGVHDPGFIRALDETTFECVARLRAAGLPVMLTLAPECASGDALRRLAATGAIVSAGHTMATAAETRRALDHGLRAFTHLFNAMPPMTSRAPGVVGAAINSEAYIGLIADGHHVAWEMLALACRARPLAGRMFLVSDAMATIGGPDHFDLYDERVDLVGGRLVNSEGALAGAHLDMVGALRNCVVRLGLDLAEAYAMAAIVPWDAVDLPRPTLATGQGGDEILMLDGDLRRVTL